MSLIVPGLLLAVVVLALGVWVDLSFQTAFLAALVLAFVTLVWGLLQTVTSKRVISRARADLGHRADRQTRARPGSDVAPVAVRPDVRRRPPHDRHRRLGGRRARVQGALKSGCRSRPARRGCPRRASGAGLAGGSRRRPRAFPNRWTVAQVPAFRNEKPRGRIRLVSDASEGLHRARLARCSRLGVQLERVKPRDPAAPGHARRRPARPLQGVAGVREMHARARRAASES